MVVVVVVVARTLVETQGKSEQPPSRPGNIASSPLHFFAAVNLCRINMHDRFICRE